MEATAVKEKGASYTGIPGVQKRIDGKGRVTFRAQVRLEGHEPRSATRNTLVQALSWKTKTEADLKTGMLAPKSQSKVTVRELMTRYLNEVLVPRREAAAKLKASGELVPMTAFDNVSTMNMLLRTMGRPLDKAVDLFEGSDLHGWRDQCLNRAIEPLTGNSVRAYVSVVARTLNHARAEWKMKFPRRQMATFIRPPAGAHRERRPEDWEIAKVWEFYGFNESVTPVSPKDYMGWVINLAIETALRRFELFAVKWSEINLDLANRGTEQWNPWLKVAKSKNDHVKAKEGRKGRTIPLTERAVDLFLLLPHTHARVIPWAPGTLSTYWSENLELMGLEDLHIHDMRHEACSRMAEVLGKQPFDLMAISGHLSLKSVAIYVNPKTKELGSRLRAGIAPTPAPAAPARPALKLVKNAA